MGMWHDRNGHQGVQHTIALIWERFYWGTMLYDIQNWVKNCQHCNVTHRNIQGFQVNVVS